jgi:hypothetical protein
VPKGGFQQKSHMDDAHTQQQHGGNPCDVELSTKELEREAFPLAFQSLAARLKVGLSAVCAAWVPATFQPNEGRESLSLPGRTQSRSLPDERLDSQAVVAGGRARSGVCYYRHHRDVRM